jgi:asparagine synthase (glutamine-hydrolysing)
MCGITGYFHYRKHELVSQEILRRMLIRLHHRGPDESGIYIEDFVGLGHVRLSIIDLESGQQPMSTINERYWIIYNGEIFNYIELKDELIQKGYKFRTTSDTEVLLNLYKAYGSLCLQKLNGQFSFAIWDKKKEELFLARDRVGIRPLYYINTSKSFIFGSEIKAIVQHPAVIPDLSPSAISEVFTFWTTLSPNTVFKDVYELPPGHFMKVNENGLSIKSYWNLQFPENMHHSHHSLQEAIEEFDSLFTDSVKIRLRADVPVGAYLSGGIDSSITTAYIKKIFPDNLKTFSIGFSEKEFDESSYQKIAVDYLQTEHYEVYCNTKDISEVFPKIIWHAEIPLTRTAPAPMFLLSKHVRNNNFKVVITGEGADEMLAGYNIFKEMQIRRFWAKDPKSKFRPLLLQKLYPYLSHLQNLNNNILKLFFGYKLTETDSPFYSHLIRWNNTNRIKNYFSDYYKENTRNHQPVNDLLRKLPENFDHLNSLSKAQWLETNIFMSGYLLSSQGDRMAMANSVEGRYPFLDHRIIEFCSKLNPDHKLDGLYEKKLLKKMMKGKLPLPIIDRPKQAYRAPVASSFLTSIPEYFHEIFNEKNLVSSGIFNPSSVHELIKKLKSGKQISEVDNMALTGIISTQLLYKQFILKKNITSPEINAKNFKIINRQTNNDNIEILNVKR